MKRVAGVFGVVVGSIEEMGLSMDLGTEFDDMDFVGKDGANKEVLSGETFFDNSKNDNGNDILFDELEKGVWKGEMKEG